MGVVHQLRSYKSFRNCKPVVVFEKNELNLILVFMEGWLPGQWRDYSISMFEDVSIFLL